MTFLLDGVQAGTFLHEPDSIATPFEYNVIVFSKALEYGNYTITVENEGQTTNQSLLLLDSIIYTCVTPFSSSYGQL